MFGDPHKEERARDKLWSMSQGKKNIRNYVMDFQEQLLLSNSSLDEDTKMMIFRKGLSYKLQDKLIGLKSKDLNELQNRTIEIADQLYRMEFRTKGNSKQRNEPQTEGKHPRRRSPSPVLDAMEGVEYTGRSGKPRRLSSSEYDRLRREGRCFNCKRRGHISTACSDDKESSKKTKKTKKTVGVARAISSGTKEKKKARKARKEESSSEEESVGIETPDEDSDSGKD